MLRLCTLRQIDINRDKGFLLRSRGQHLPIGLAHKVKLKRDIAEGQAVSWDDVEYDASSEAVKVRREMEKTFGA